MGGFLPQKGGRWERGDRRGSPQAAANIAARRCWREGGGYQKPVGVGSCCPRVPLAAAVRPGAPRPAVPLEGRTGR